MAPPTIYYQHRPLPTARSIRTLRLRPSPSRDTELRCSLVPVSLDESPGYTAISYTWGAQTPSYPIRCQEGDSSARLNVTPNCAAALRRLRDATEERILWVDSICINQESIEERSSQVALMGEIYANAERVAVWLGESDRVSEQAISLLKQIGPLELHSKSILDPSTGNINIKRRKRRQKEVHGNARKLTKNVKSHAEDVFGPFFRRSWFYRMWTVQEVVLLAPDRVDFYCGETSISWLTIWFATDVLGAIEYQWSDWESTMALLRYLTQMMVRYHAPYAKEIWEKIPGLDDQLNLSQLLIFCRAKLATDPKDKVYAIYGLLDNFNIELPKPDYEKPLAEIYAGITATSIKFDKDLFLLNYVPSDNRRPGLPSWVPDWSDPEWTGNDARYPLVREDFAASGRSEPKWKFTPNPLELIVYGKLIDTVIYRAGSFTSKSPSYMLKSELDLMQRDAAGRIIVSDFLRDLYNAFQTLRAWVRVAHWAEVYPTGEHVNEALSRTLLNEFPSFIIDPEIDEFHEWLTSMCATEAELAGRAAPLALRLCTPQPLQARLRTLLDTLFRPDRALETKERRRQEAENEVPAELRMMLPMMLPGGGWGYHSRAVTFSSRKCFFRTSGGFFGLAPDLFPGSLQNGDELALIAGLGMPVLLRRQERGFTLVSHCHVHGMMYGEFWERCGGFFDELMLI